MNPTTSHSFHASLRCASKFLLAALCLLLTRDVFAQSTYFWVGRDTSPTFFGAYWTYNNNFSTSSGGGGLGSSIPSLQNYLNFDGNAVGGYTSTNDFAAGSGGFQIYFKNGASAYNLYGNSITFYDISGNDPNIQNEGAFTNQTINFPIVDGNNNGANGVLNINLNSGSAQGPLTFNGTLTSADAGKAVRAINVYGTNSVTFNNVISDFSGSGKIALTQLGTGTTMLNGTTTYTGDTTISAGAVTVGSAGRLGSGTYAGNITDNGALIINSTNSQTLSGNIAGSGTLTKSGNNALTLTGSNTYSGGTTLGSAATININTTNAIGTGTFTVNGNGFFDNTSGGAISNANNNALTLSGGSPTFLGSNSFNFGNGIVTIGNANRTLTVNSNTLTLGGGVTDGGLVKKLTKAGAGTLLLNGVAGTWTGGSSVDAGTLTIGTDTTLGTGTVALNGGTLTAGNGARVLANAAALTASSTLGGANNLTFNGGLTNSGGSRTLAVANTATTTLAGSVFLSDDNTTGSRALTITNIAPVIISGSISNNNAGNTVAAGLTYLGTNTLTLSNSNNFTGATTISGGTLITANSNAITTTGGVIFNGTTGTTTLDVQTDGGDAAFPVNFGSTTIGSTVASDVKTGSVGINHTLGALNAGNATLNIIRGPNVVSGSPAITFGAVNMSAGTAGTTILNPTTASLSLGAVSIGSGSNPKTLQLDGTSTNNTVTGAIANGLNIVTVFKNNSGTWTLSNSGNSYSGNTTVGGGTLNLTGGSGVTNGFFVNNGGMLNLGGTFGTNAVTANNFIIGQAAGKGTLNILSGSTVPRVNMFVGDNATGDGAVFQTGGTVTLSQAAGIDNLRVGSAASGKGYYKLTGGSVTAVRPAIGASLTDTVGVFDMTNGTFTSTEQIHISAGSATSSGLLNVMGGTVNAGTDIRMFTLQAGTAGAAQQAVLNVGGGTGAASVTTVNNIAQGLNMAQTANVAGELGVVNLLANGTLTTSRILGTQLNPTLHFNFNGGTLKANALVANPLFNDSGVDAINVYSTGGTIDNSGVALALGRPLLAPTGTGVSSITGPSTQGSNYIGAPLVVISGGTGSGATAYAVMADDGSGKTFKVASIVVTSPGLYTVAPTTVTLFGGGAGVVASGFTINTAANTSGNMTFIGSGVTTLNGNNTYAGSTLVSGGELLGLTGGSCSNSSVIVASSATNGVQLAAANGQWACSNLTYNAGAAVDFYFNGFAPSSNTAPLLVNSNLTFIGTPGVIVRSAGVVIAPGQYPLIKYSGALAGTPPTTAVALPGGVTATISNNVANNSIDLVVTIGNTVSWAVGNAAWDINTTANWKNTGGAAVNYLDGEAVLLDDTASGVSPITVFVAATMTPSSFTVSNATKTYTLTSNGVAGAIALNKLGAGALNLNTNNTFTGGINIGGGTVTLNATTAAGAGLITLSNGATLGVNNIASGLNITVANAVNIVAGASVIMTGINLGSGVNGNVTSADSASTINIPSSTTLGGVLTGFTGTMTVAGGTMRFSNGSTGASLGSAGASFVINSTSPGLQPRNNGTTINLGSLSGSGTLAAPNTPTAQSTTTYSIGALNTSTTFSGKFIETSSTTNTAVTKVGTGTLTLSGISTNTGATTINAGALLGVTGGSMLNSPVTVNTGATNGVVITTPGGVWTVTNLTYAAGTETTIFAFGGNTPSTTVAPLNVQNNLTISGTLNLIVTGSSLAFVTNVAYPLIKYTNTLTGTVPANPLSLPLYVSGIITNDTANKVIALIVTNIATPTSLVWSAGTGAWDFSSLNWAGGTAVWSDTNAAFLDDTASGAGPFTVTLTTDVAPIGVTVSNLTKNYTLAGAAGITGFYPLTKMGAGMLTIANSNSFVGLTTINGGTLQLGNGGTAGTLANMAIVDNGALVINHSDAVAISSVISGTGSFTNAGGGTTTVSVTNTYAGNTTVKAGTLQMTDSGNLAPASTLVLSGGQFTRASQNFTPVKSNAYKFGLNVTADSTVATTATSTRTVHFDSSNITAVPGTTLFVTNAAATGTNHFKFYTGGFTYAGNLVLAGNGGNNMTFLESYNTNDTVLDQIFSGVISGPGRLYKNIEGSSPGGNLIISNAANTFAGGTELRAGYIGLGADNPLGTGRVTFGYDLNPLGFYAVDAPRTLTNDIFADVNSGSTTTAAGCTNLQIKGSQNLTLSGRILIHTNIQFFIISNSAITTFSGVVTNAAANSLGIAKLGSGTLVLAGNNTYLGDTRANVGVLRLGASNVIPDGAGKGNVSVSDTLDLNTFSETINGLSGAGIIDTAAGGSPLLTVGNNNASSSFGGIIKNTAGSLALTKTGSGLLTLTGANTFSGTTTVGAGTLALSGASVTLASANIAVAANALFDVSGITGGFTLGAAQTLSGFGAVNGTLTNNGTIALGSTIGTLTWSNSPVLNGMVVVKLDRGNAQNADKLVLTTGTFNYGGALIVTNIGAALLAGDTFTNFAAAGYAGAFTNTTLPTLGAGLSWNTSQLAVNGSIQVVLLPAVTVSPGITNFVYGNNTLLTAGATGSAPLTYQWYDKNTNAISSATNATLALTVPAVAASGNYSVIVANAYGSATNLAAVTVTPAPLSVTANNTNRVYGAANPAFTASYSGFVNSETPAVISGSPSLTTTTSNTSPVGIYTITAAVGSLTAANYGFVSFTNGTLTINPAALSVTANSTSKTYGSTVTFAGTEFSNSTLVGSDSVTSVTLTSAGAANTATVSSYPIIPSAATGSGLTNYNITYNNGTLVVNPLAVVLSGTRAFDGTTNAAAAILSEANAFGTDDVIVASGTGGLAGSAVGTQTITSFGTLALGGTTAGNYTLTGASGSVVITAAGTALTLTSSANPSGYLGALSFTVTLAPTNATGNVTFYNGATPFSTNALTLGVATSGSISTLARGTNTITATYLGDGTYLGRTNSLAQVVTNHPPVATLAGYYRGAVPTWKILLTDIVTNIADADSDTITVTSPGTSTNGVTLTTGSGFVFYYNTNIVNDQFTYTVSDGNGGSTTGTVNLTAQAFLNGQNATVTVSGSTATVNFAGIPGFNYTAQRSTNLTVWADILTTNAPSGGLFRVVDDFSDLGVVPPSAYYRLQYNP